MLPPEDSAVLAVARETPIVVKYEPCRYRGRHAVLASAVPDTMGEHVERLHTLALAGLLARHVSGDPLAEPPHTTLTYTLTALGRREQGPVQAKRPVRRAARPVDEDLEEAAA